MPKPVGKIFRFMKNVITLLFLLSAGSMLGQKQVVSAFNANKTGDFASAASYIDEAITIEKAALKDKTWRYRGEIYLNIAQDSALSLAYPQALWTARDSYKKSARA